MPLLFLVAFFGYSVSGSVGTALALTRSQAMMKDLQRPIAALQRALGSERALVLTYDVKPAPAGLAALRKAQATTDRAVTAFRAAAQSTSVRQSASAAGRKALAVLSGGLARLPLIRAQAQTRRASPQAFFSAYSNLIAASYDVLEQAVLQEGNSSQVLPGIAVIELAISGEYVQQESALLDSDFAVSAFPVSAHQAFVSLVGAHRLLFQQSWHYLTPAERGYVRGDLSARTSIALARMENAISAKVSPHGPPATQSGRWNTTVAAYSGQVQHAVGQSLAQLAADARSQADARIRSLYVAGLLGLAAVVLSIAVSLWLAANLTRQLAGLRDDALELANVRLPRLVRRLRAGENVDVAAEAPDLDAGPDEIGQVRAAFNAARRTAIEAAVDEANARRGVSDVFRNLARRSQSLLHRQMALLDTLERRENEPDNLESLFRIDHLTTRMRRHSESLIVLAGDAPQRSWRNPVPFVDVLRAAASEVEDYTRIRAIVTTPAALAGPAVADVIHLLAELAENATLFSPRHTQVVITGQLVGRGFVVEIEDRGLGLTDEELATLNDRLADPPPFDLSGTEQLGIFVAAQLARRHSIAVSLRHSPYGGVIAVVLIPADLIVAPGAAEFGEVQAIPANRRLAMAGRHAVREPWALAERPGDADGGPAEPPAWPDSQPAAEFQPAEFQPAESGWRAGWDSPEPPPASAPDSATDGATVPSPRSQPSAGGSANSGPRLPQRVRQASLAPQLRSMPIAAPAEDDEPLTREPETARRVMSAFRRGWRAGLDDPGEPAAPTEPAPEEGENR